jgi:hypothetical protein
MDPGRDRGEVRSSESSPGTAAAAAVGRVGWVLESVVDSLLGGGRGAGAAEEVPISSGADRTLSVKQVRATVRTI